MLKHDDRAIDFTLTDSEGHGDEVLDALKEI